MSKARLTSERGRKIYPQSRKGKGGAHGRVQGVPGNEAHHIPPKSVSMLSEYSGPAISISAADHEKTRSYGSGAEAEAYREKQRALIERGKFREAQQMDIEDIREKFPGKYERQIQEMLDYTEELYNDPIKKELLKRARRK